MKKLYFFAAFFTIQLFFAQENMVDVKLNIYNYGASSRPTRLTEFNGNILFSAFREERNGGNELWKHNIETDKSSIIKNYSQTPSSYITRIKSNIVKFNGKIYYIGTENGAANNQLWESDGTTIGTKLIKHLFNSSLGDTQKNLFIFNGKIFIVTDDQIWASDGTGSGTVLLTENRYNYKFFSLNNKLYFFQNSYENNVLMVTDGTTVGTKIFKSFEPTLTLNYTNDEIIVFQDHLYFIAKLNGTKSLWRSDGTEEGTNAFMPTSVNILRGETLPDKFVFYDDSNNLWSSDGTAANTSLYKTLPAVIQKMFTFKNDLYIDTAAEFYKTDGTAANTLVHNFTDNDATLNYYTQSSQKNYLFLKEQYEYNNDTYIWDGSATIPTKLNFAKSYTRATDYLEINNEVYYQGYSSKNGEEIYKYNFATKNEKLVTDINFVYDSRVTGYLKIDNNLFFSAVADSFPGQKQLFKKDLLTGETHQISNFTTEVTEGENSLKVGNYYYAYSYGTSLGFYRSDGSSENTQTIMMTGKIQGFFNFNDHAVIYLTRTNQKIHLYLLENNASEPVLLKEQAYTDYLPAANGAVINNELYFVFPDSNKHLSIWKTDGTAQNTVKRIEFPYDNLQQLKILGTTNSKVIFYKYTGAEYNKFQLYSSNGNIGDINLLSTLNAEPVDKTAVFKDKLFFLAGSSLSSTDGTIAGTQSVRDVGPYNYNWLLFKNCGKNLYAMLDNSLWRTDGTAGGTMIIVSNMNPNEMVCHKDYLYTSTFGKAQLFRTDGNRNKNIYINVNVKENNTQVDEQHEVLNVGFTDMYSDEKTIYFTGYGNKTDYQQYVVLNELPQYLATNESTELNKKFSIQIYPNPSVAEINVKTTNGELIKKIQIIDGSGKVVLTSLTEKNIDISKLNQSVYFVKIYTDSEIYTSKLIKK